MADDDSPNPLPVGLNEQILHHLNLVKSGAALPPMDGLYQALVELAAAGYSVQFGIGPAPPAAPRDDPSG